MGRRYPKDKLLELYRRHPMSEERLLARLRRRYPDLEGVSAPDLAFDEETQRTDQNHIGGGSMVGELARWAEVKASDTVLDLGCGLGGSVRLLVHLTGCRGVGVDLSRERLEQAARLNRLVGLEERIELRRDDMEEMPVPRRRFDVVWGQSAWAHVASKTAFLLRWQEGLQSGGRIACEDSCLIRRPRGAEESRRLRRLEDAWMSSVEPLEVWTDGLRGATRCHLEEDLGAVLVRHFEALAEAQGSGDLAHGDFSEEKQSWEDAAVLARQGVLGYFRLVAWFSG